MAPVSYIFAALLAGSCTIPRTTGMLLTGIAALLLFNSAHFQLKISDEISQVKPLLEHMEKNAKVLPMTFNPSSEHLDHKFFPEFHSHDYFYYHIIQGGGVSPYLFPSPMLPVQVRPGLDLPHVIHGFSWQEQGYAYRYIMARKAPKGFQPFVQKYAKLKAKNGDWMLFENRTPATGN